MTAEHASRESLWARWERAPESARLQARRRLPVVRAIVSLADGGMSRRAAVSMVAASGELNPDGVSARALGYWLAAIRPYRVDDWPAALLPRQWEAERPAAGCDEEVWKYFEGLFLSTSRRSYAEAYRLSVQAKYRIDPPIGATGRWPGMPSGCPTLIQLRRRLDREIPSALRVLARRGVRDLESFFPTQERDHTVFFAGQAVNVDARTSKVYVKAPNGKIFRPRIVSAQDVFSSRRVGWRVAETENGDAMRLLFSDLGHGRHCPAFLPELVFFDNTRAASNKLMTGGASFRFRFRKRDDDALGVLRQLGIEPRFTRPYSGRSKPVERLHRDDIQHLDKHPELSGAMAQRGAVPLDRFCQIVDKVFAAENARTGRSGRGANGRSYDQIFEESFSTAPVRRPTSGQLRLLLLAADRVRVARNGEISFLGSRFYGGPMPLVAGGRAIIRFDPEDLGGGIFVYSSDGRFVGHAARLEAAGFNDTSAARELARSRRIFVKSARSALEAERRISEIVVGQELSGAAAEKAQPPARIVAMMREPAWARATRKAPPPIAHADRAQIDLEYARVVGEMEDRKAAATAYNEEELVEEVRSRYQALMATPRESWAEDDVEFEARVRDLPEIRALQRAKSMRRLPSAGQDSDTAVEQAPAQERKRA